MIVSKFKFTNEYPINASARMVYPYLSTASGLAQWFCQDVRLNEDKIFNFIWDDQNHYAEINNHRTNKSVRFVFLDELKNHEPDPSYMDFCIVTSELTQEHYLRIIDYSEVTDKDELNEMWDSLIQRLRDIIGG